MGVLAILSLSGALLAGASPLGAPPSDSPTVPEICRAFRDLAELPPCAGPQGCQAKELLDELLGTEGGPRRAAPGLDRPHAAGFVVAGGTATWRARREALTAPPGQDLLALARAACEARAAGETADP